MLQRNKIWLGAGSDVETMVAMSDKSWALDYHASLQPAEPCATLKEACTDARDGMELRCRPNAMAAPSQVAAPGPVKSKDR